MYYILYSYLNKGGESMNQYVEDWKIDVKNIERALGYMNKALGLDMWAIKFDLGLVQKIM